MSTYARYVNPDLALKQAREYVEIHEQKEALETLHTVLSSKRYNTRNVSSFDVFEDVVTLYLDLCVELRDTRMAKEGLHQFKNNTRSLLEKQERLAAAAGDDGPSALERILRHFLDRSEEATRAARADADRRIAQLSGEFAPEAVVPAAAAAATAAVSTIPAAAAPVPGVAKEENTEAAAAEQKDEVSDAEKKDEESEEEEEVMERTGPLRLTDLKLNAVAEAKKQQELASKEAKMALLLEDTPESTQLTNVSGEGPDGRIERIVLNPWLRFCWECYRSVLDILRNNAKLEPLYKETALRAFDFCQTYKRRTEFRRLCEMLRLHFSYLVKGLQSGSAADSNGYGVLLSECATQELQLSIRFRQLKTALDMTLWHDAFRSVDDINVIVRHCEEDPTPEVLRELNEYFCTLFWNASNLLFHAACTLEVVQIAIDMRSDDCPADDPEMRYLATRAYLAALCIPPPSTNDDGLGAEFGVEIEKNNRLATLLRMSTPSRDALIKAVLHPEVFSFVDPNVASLLECFESFHPLRLAKSSATVLNYVRENESYQQYHRALQSVRIVRLLQQLSTVYRTIRLENLRQMVGESSVPALRLKVAAQTDVHSEEAAASDTNLERLMVRYAAAGYCDVRFDHQQALVRFNQRALHSVDARTQLTAVSRNLQQVVERVQPELAQQRAERKAAVFRAAATAAEEEHARTLQRKAEIELRKEREEAQERRRRQHEEEARRAAAEEAARLKAEELARKQAEEEEAFRQLKAEQAQKLEDERVDPAAEMKERVEKVRIERERTDRKLRKMQQELQVLVRARRTREHPLLAAKLAAEVAADEEYYEKQRVEQEKKHRELHRRQLEEKKRLSALTVYRDQFVSSLLQKRKEQHAQALEKHAAQQNELRERLKALQEQLMDHKEERVDLQDEADAEEEEQAMQKKSGGADGWGDDASPPAAGSGKLWGANRTRGLPPADSGERKYDAEDRGVWSSNHDVSWGRPRDREDDRGAPPPSRGAGAAGDSGRRYIPPSQRR